MRQLNTEVDIAAPIDVVWGVLSDMSRYRAWNPFINEVEGSVEQGAHVRIFMHFPGKGTQRYTVKLTKILQPHSLWWLGTFHVRGLIDGDHRFELTALSEGRTRVRQTEYFGGILIPLVWNGFIVKNLLPSFHALNANLKAYCEGRSLPVGLPEGISG